MKNIGQMMKQAQAMQANLKKAQEELRLASYEGSAGSGLVKVVLAGDHSVKTLTLDPSLMQEEKDVLEDLIIAALNDANRRLEQITQEKMSSLTAGLPLPPGFKF